MKSLSILLAIVLSGCASSGVVTGNARSKLHSPNDVRVYDPDTAPKKYEVIGMVTSVNSWSGHAIGGLKKRAAQMGANGVIVTRATMDAWSGGMMEGKAIYVEPAKAD